MFNSLHQLRVHWKDGMFGYPPELTIANIPYKLQDSSDNSFADIILHGKKGFIVYHTSDQHRQEAKEAGLHQWIVLVWMATARSVVVPYDITTMAPHQFVNYEAKGFPGPELTELVPMGESQDRIGVVAILKMFLPSGTAAIKGRVDTGAEISSLHAENIQIRGDKVSFLNKDLSPNIITFPLAEKQAVQSADGGTTYRPVIETSIELNGKSISNVLFNLNDRSDMDYPVLIGQNVLTKANVLVDPDMGSSTQPIVEHVGDGWISGDQFEIDWDKLQKTFNDSLIERDSDMTEQQSLVQLIVESNLSITDLVRRVRTDAFRALEETIDR